MADDFDMRAHNGTYTGFTKLLTYVSIGLIAVLVLMGLFIA